VEGLPVNPAVLFGLGTMLAWGFWIVFGDVASNAIDPEMAAFVSYTAAAVCTGVYVLVSDASLVVTDRGLVFSAAAGLAAAIGVLSTFIGVTVGSTSVVSTIGGMYFVTAAVISIIALGEPLSANKVAGIGLALGAIVLMSQ
jgi:transporter family protein